MDEDKKEIDKKNEENTGIDFIRNIINEDLKNNKNKGKVITRFPPEPNGYLHIGHAKSICLNFGIAKEYGGRCHLRFDDTNPITEDVEYVESIQTDIRWLGFDWNEHKYYASDYFERLYLFAEELILSGKAYVCELNEEEVREYRGTLKKPGKNSPFRDRPIKENLEIFRKMAAGEFDEGRYVLRAKIDMTSPNMNMRDPIMYRIRKANHHMTGDKWKIYPMYDYAHCLSDAIEGITHSICTLEFEDHRPLYDWFINQVTIDNHPQQIEFARLNLTYTVMSKRKLLELVENKFVKGWDDPRMPTISGLRRRGFTPESIKDFCDRIGVAKAHSTVDIALLEYCIREDLNKKAQRTMAVIDPLKVIITNYPEDMVEEFEAENNPENPEMGTYKVPFSKIVYIERDDFRETPPPKYHRLSPGKEIRLKYAYYIKCEKVIKDEKTGEILEIHCTYDPESRGGWTKDGRKVKGTSHWVSEKNAVDAEVRLYDYLFTKPNPYETEEEDEENSDYKKFLNPDSLKILTKCKIEKRISDSEHGKKFQFLRLGYFCVDIDAARQKPVFNRIVQLRDTWAKIEKSESRGAGK